MKRTLDIALTVLGLLIFAPLIFLLSIIIYFDLGRPIFFTQKRAGKNGKPFNIVKFCTMRTISNDQEAQLSDAERQTRISRLVRAASLDELPGLWNVLTGDMSLVGPRPLLLDYLPLYTEHQNRRHKVLPGITGWAQINGRNLITWEERFNLDVWYVDNQSTLLDFSILFKTVWKVLSREGVNTATDSSMPRFTGTTEVSKCNSTMLPKDTRAD